MNGASVAFAGAEFSEKKKFRDNLQMDRPEKTVRVSQSQGLHSTRIGLGVATRAMQEVESDAGSVFGTTADRFDCVRLGVWSAQNTLIKIPTLNLALLGGSLRGPL